MDLKPERWCVLAKTNREDGGPEALAAATGRSGSVDAPMHPKRVMMPLEPDTKLRTWAMLLLALALVVVPLVIGFEQPHVTRSMEKAALTISREMWTSVQQGDHDAWLNPTQNGHLRVNKAPLLPWMHTLIWMDLEPATATAEQLIIRARLLALAMMLLMLAATYWAGYSIGGVRCATMATLVAGTTVLIMRHGRTATYDTHLMMWVTLSIACGLWAIRPLKPVNWLSRRVSGWLFAGVALAMANLVNNPFAVVLVGLPLATTIMVAPRRRLGNTIGLIFALLLGCLLAAPWYLYVLEYVPDGLEQLKRELMPSANGREPFYFYAVLLIFIFPWSVFLFGSLFQPFLRAQGEHRRRTLLGWLWFICGLALLMIPAMKSDRYLLPLIPAVGVLVGQLWAYHAWLATQGLKDPGVNWLRIPHWVMLIVGSVALPLFVIDQRQLIERGWLDRVVLPGLPWYVAAATGGVMLLVAVYGMIRHFKWKPVSAFACTVLWMVVAMTMIQFSYARSSENRTPLRTDAARVATVLGDLPLYYLYDAKQDLRGPANVRNFEPDEQFLFYTGRVVPPIHIEQLADRADEPHYVMVRLDEQESHVAMLRAWGYQSVMTFSDGRHPPGFTPTSRLFRSSAVANDPGEE